MTIDATLVLVERDGKVVMEAIAANLLVAKQFPGRMRWIEDAICNGSGVTPLSGRLTLLSRRAVIPIAIVATLQMPSDPNTR